MIRAAETTDARCIADIYNWYVEHSTVTFETERVSEAEMDRRISRIRKDYDWLVCEEAGRVAGYAYYGPFRERAAYRATMESTVYVTQESQGRGIGTQLYSALIDRAAALGFREMLGVIALPNEPSVRLHERLGFRKVGHLERVGNKFGKWIDVGIWQRHLKEPQG
jgi:L-amino acid N-acyltransferase YncA